MNVDGSADVSVQLDGGRIFAQRLDRIHRHLALVNGDAVLCLERLNDVLGGDGTVQTVVRTGTGLNFDDGILQLGGDVACLCALHLNLVCLGCLFVLYDVDRLIIGGNRELLGEKEVTGVAVGDLYDLILLSGAFDIGK